MSVSKTPITCDTLICTVGVSLLGQAQRLEPIAPLRQAMAGNNIAAVAQALLALAPLDRACGAEINSVASIVACGGLRERRRLVLLTSDTVEGQEVGDYLQRYFSAPRCPVGFAEVSVNRVEGLDDANPKRFRTQGLKDLVRRVGEVIRKEQAHRVAINATGGYKAQISFAGLIGQALGVPVYYMFERFTEVVELPPMPVALDYSLWLENYELFRFLEKQSTCDTARLERELGRQPDARLEPLLDRVEDQLVALSPMGELFHQQFTYRFWQDRGKLLPPGVDANRRSHPDQDRRLKNSSHLNHVTPDGLFRFLAQVFTETPYIRRFHAFYTNPDLSEEIRFRQGNTDGHHCLELVYSDGAATAKLEAELDTTDMAAIRAAVADLNQRFTE